MALITSVALAWAAWLHFGPPPAPEPPSPGSFPPPLRLLDADDGEPVVLLGRGKVVWLTFWSAASPSAATDLAQLERSRSALKGRRAFLPVLAAVDADTPERLLVARERSEAGLPVYVAPPEVRRAFGVGSPPLHVLLDSDGRVSAVAAGWGDATLERLARRAQAALDELEPSGRVRFAVVAR